MSLFENDVFAIAYLCVIIGLIVIFCISFTLFVKRLVLRASVNKTRSRSIEEKIDRIIELLEREKK
ncbi:DUF4083 domain-containing protein [Bacillus sp. Xin]|uniref:DUF4083 domain-containing protein n=1 Tax=unclassified Bacillus (in: firmicutes) TaxID=185979 RepID=UPI001572C006|nr:MULTISPECIES: DUF4083 domain-containing protein [unclassified Bacillus (in: firmicutes)]MBC6972282.1 DUF4083 domain-containing protein [Bacillus sp. Xin]NSW38179.1 DUF4083 domain-containing protein [Bacillus sp. Xin1]